MGGGGGGEGEFTGDDRIESSVLKAEEEGGMDAGEFGGRRICQNHAADFGVAGHGVAGIDFDGAAAANDDDASAWGEEGEVLGEVPVGQHFEDDVHAATTGFGHELGGVIGGAMVEDFVGALFQHEFTAFLRASGGEDVEALGAGDLDSGEADTATATVNQDHFSGDGLGAIH